MAVFTCILIGNHTIKHAKNQFSTNQGLKILKKILKILTKFFKNSPGVFRFCYFIFDHLAKWLFTCILIGDPINENKLKVWSQGQKVRKKSENSGSLPKIIFYVD